MVRGVSIPLRLPGSRGLGKPLRADLGRPAQGRAREYTPVEGWRTWDRKVQPVWRPQANPVNGSEMSSRSHGLASTPVGSQHLERLPYLSPATASSNGDRAPDRSASTVGSVLATGPSGDESGTTGLGTKELWTLTGEVAAIARASGANLFYRRVGKPALDRLLGCVLFVALLPLMLVIAFVIRVHLGPGVLHRQDRVGLSGEPFRLMKFRTMQPSRRHQQVDIRFRDRRTSHKRDDDPRHTKLGKFLRRLSLDELPQLWHVATGKMSLVGPRPELVEVVSRYEAWQHLRHTVRPGLTGLWQVSERNTSEQLMSAFVHLDLEYISRMSLAEDLAILWRTLGVLRPGAAGGR